MVKPNDKWVRIIGIPLVGFLNPILFQTYTGEYWTLEFYVNALFAIIFTLIVWEGNRYIILKLRSKFPEYENTVKRLVYQGLLITIYTVIAVSGLMYGVVLLDPGTPRSFMLTSKIGLASAFFVFTIYETAYFLKKWKESIIEAEQFKAESIRSQYNALKNQVDPHFLFNSLNTLITLIEEDQELGSKFTERLAQVYRYVLDNREKDLIDLKSEMDFITSYLFLHQMRFGNSIIINIDINEQYLDRKLPPLALQLLVENAVKHNIISSRKPLSIDIFIEKGAYITVRNNLQKKKSIYSSGIGLNNITIRYKFLCSEEVVISSSTDYFSVSLPLLK